MSEFFGWLEASALGHAMRENGVWIYALVNLAHIVSVAILFGSILILDLRLLGAWRAIPLATLARPAVALAGIGLMGALLTGPALLATKASEYVGNPFLYAKFVAIGFGLVNLAVLHALPAWRAKAEPHSHPQLRIAGGLSLACWLTAITCGRMIGYF